MKTTTRKWDFGSYKLHPIGDVDPCLRVRVGSRLYRGTTTRYLTGQGVKNVDPSSSRIYLTEADEDAAGYAYTHKDPGSGVSRKRGGKPVLVVVRVDVEVLRGLKPGFEGGGEWFLEGGCVPWRSVGDVLELPRTEEEWSVRHFPTLNLPSLRDTLPRKNLPAVHV